MTAAPNGKTARRVRIRNRSHEQAGSRLSDHLVRCTSSLSVAPPVWRIREPISEKQAPQGKYAPPGSWCQGHFTYGVSRSRCMLPITLDRRNDRGHRRKRSASKVRGEQSAPGFELPVAACSSTHTSISSPRVWGHSNKSL